VPVAILIVYYDILAYSSLVVVTDMSIDTRFILEEKHENMTEGMRRMDAKYEELPSGRRRTSGDQVRAWDASRTQVMNHVVK
jgi:hypothetical protein